MTSRVLYYRNVSNKNSILQNDYFQKGLRQNLISVVFHHTNLILLYSLFVGQANIFTQSSNSAMLFIAFYVM